MAATTAPGKGRGSGRPGTSGSRSDQTKNPRAAGAGTASGGQSGTRSAGQALTVILGPALAAAGFDLEDVEVRRVGSRHVVAVSVDRDGGVDLDAVADASRTVSETLDSAPAETVPAALRSAYTLEVTSRGVDRPLTAARHWRRAVGRLVEVRRRDAPVLTGRVLRASEDGAELEVAGGGTVSLAFDEVVRAVVQVEFNRPASAELDADQIEVDDAELDDAELDDAGLDDDEPDAATL